ncbi:hypothetical protein [Halovenus salina]|uniref:Uncharacterized protein n=1 Tax=Halovenus salina TaxID=1510225 RepID=A0ABD5W753_9EURY|nr:hypothetical protein [Halovenus salina]
MRLPVPKNKLVALTLVGAALTAVVAVALAAPLGGLAQAGGQDDVDGQSNVSQVDADAPTPNQDFDPNVQTQSRYDEEGEEYEEHEEDEEYEEEDEEYEEEDDEHEEEDDEHEEDEEDEEYDNSEYAPRGGENGGDR